MTYGILQKVPYILVLVLFYFNKMFDIFLALRENDFVVKKKKQVIKIKSKKSIFVDFYIFVSK